MNEKELADSIYANSGNYLMPFTQIGFELWTKDDMASFWDGFDAMSYAMFQLVTEGYPQWNYDTQIHNSLARRAKNDEMLRSFHAEVAAARSQVLADLNAATAKNPDKFAVSYDELGTGSIQLRFIPTPG